MIGANFGLKIGTRAESEEHSGYRTKNMAWGRNCNRKQPTLGNLKLEQHKIWTRVARGSKTTRGFARTDWCNCGTTQTMSHLLQCSLAPTSMSDDVFVPTDAASKILPGYRTQSPFSPSDTAKLRDTRWQSVRTRWVFEEVLVTGVQDTPLRSAIQSTARSHIMPTFLCRLIETGTGICCL